MHQVLFTTKRPNDHIPRALDILRKMGFALRALSAEETGACLFGVRLHYLPRGSLSSQTFVDRLMQFGGLEICQQTSSSNVIPQMGALCGTVQPNFSAGQSERLS
jgi:hypothetical protein